MAVNEFTAKLSSVDEYLILDDNIVWAHLRKHPEARVIIADLDRRKLLKCAYEKIFFIKDEFLSSLFTKDTVRDRMEEEIAPKAKASVENASIDSQSLPSVPYHSAAELEPMDIPVFYRGSNGEKLPRKISELSKIVDVLMAYMNIPVDIFGTKFLRAEGYGSKLTVVYAFT